MPIFEHTKKIYMKHSKLSYTTTLLLFVLLLPACQNEASKKSEAAENVSKVACQDAKDMITAHANDVVPIIGKLLLNLAVKGELKDGAICDCLLPAIKKDLATYPEAELQAMLIDKPMRTKAIKKAFVQNKKEVFSCYKEKGLKGLKLIENFIDKIVK